MTKNIQVKNLVEDQVWELIPDVIKTYPDACTCDFCLADIAALALISLTPKYVVRTNGEIISRTADLPQSTTTIVVELAKAIETVSRNPKHKTAPNN